MLVFLFFFLLILNSVEADCPFDAFEWNSNCYSFYDNSTGFADSELSCKQIGGHLVSIHDGLINALLGQEGIKKLHKSTETDFWIGATNLMKPPTWNWTDGSGLDFSDWKKGEPQNTSGANCATLSMTDGYWAAQDCFKPKPFACQVPSSFFTVSTTPSYPTNVNCSAGWTYFPPTHSCYGVNAGGYSANWTAAETYCQNNGAHLPSIHSYAEFEYLLSYLYYAWNSPWTGIFSPDSGRTWRTSDGTPADFLSYGSWCSGHPQNATGERCVLIDYVSNTRCYSDYDCTQSAFRTLCKKSL